MTLTASDVENYVNRLVFMPGWTFDCFPTFSKEDSMRTVRVMFTPFDTSRPPNYEVRLGYAFERTVAVDAGQHDSITIVGAKILTACMLMLSDPDYIEHECREFFRLHVGTNRATDEGAENYHAPFHPHVLSGRRAWAEAMRLEWSLEG